MVFRSSFFVFRFALPHFPETFARLASSFHEKRKTKNPKRSFQGFGLFDEHDGNIVLDLIEQLTLVADEAVAFVVEADVPLALGAGQDVQQFFADGHGSSVRSN
jgi:hypothetical protein